MEVGYLIQGGEVYDGTGGAAQQVDVRVRGGIIAEIGPSLPVQGEQVLDASGLIVAPGLIDLHVHVFSGVGRWSVDPDDAGLATGVTTLLDTGTAGALTYPAFHRFVISQAREDIFALLNISMIGCLLGYPNERPYNIGELSDPGYAHAPSAVACVELFRDRIVGLKARLSAVLANHEAGHEWAGLEALLDAAEQTNLPCMIHHARSQVPLSDLLRRLRPGDIYTHLYHPHADHGFAADGAPKPEMMEARDRGVLFDVGHGKGAFSWEVAEAACRGGGFWPDTISTDVHRFNIRGPVFDLPTTMSKFRYLGMPLSKIIQAATDGPAHAMGLQNRYGRLLPGRQADISLLRIEAGSWALPDVLDEVRIARERLVAVHVFKQGVLYACRSVEAAALSPNASKSSSSQ